MTKLQRFYWNMFSKRCGLRAAKTNQKVCRIFGYMLFLGAGLAPIVAPLDQLLVALFVATGYVILGLCCLHLANFDYDKFEAEFKQLLAEKESAVSFDDIPE